MDFLISDLFFHHVLPHLSFLDVHALLCLCWKVNRYIDSDRVWRHFVEKYNVYWKLDDFIDQDTGGTSIRCIIEEELENIDPFVERQYENGEMIKETLLNPKGLLKETVRKEREYNYFIIAVSYMLLLQKCT